MNPHPGRSINTETYDGTRIPNSIDPDPSPAVIAFSKKSLKKGNLILSGVKLLGPPSGRYNCHGLVFANRRTNVPPAGMPDAVKIDDLLIRDEYEKVASPQLGDIAIYREPAGDIDHCGIVSRVESIGLTERVFVWSKWGALEECEHPELACPYADCRVEYWRLKR